MKTLKFRSNLIPLILSGDKTVTWRLFDDKDLQVGDKLYFLNKANKETFAKAEIVHIKEKTLRKIAKDQDFIGHEKYKNSQEMLDHYKEYYGEQVNWETNVKMIEFKILTFKV